MNIKVKAITENRILKLVITLLFLKEPRSGNKKKFANKMRSIVSAVKTAQRLEVRLRFAKYRSNEDKK